MEWIVDVICDEATESKTALEWTRR